MLKGTVKKLKESFGFLRGDDQQGTEYFFHQSDVEGGGGFMGLREGQSVTFEEGPIKSGKGPRAERVRPA